MLGTIGIWLLTILIPTEVLAADPPPPTCPPESRLVVHHWVRDGVPGVMMSCLLAGTERRHGPFVVYEGGVLTQDESYDHDKPHGLFRQWDQKARWKRYGHYEHGAQVGFWAVRDENDGELTLHEFGVASAPREFGPYRVWTYDLRAFRWGPTGLASVATYVGDAISHGREWDFHPNGPLASQVDHFEDKLVGRGFAWDAHGKFQEAWCYAENSEYSAQLWSTTDYDQALARPCPSERLVQGISPPPGDHAIPPPSAATHDLVPPDVDLPGLTAPVAPPFPLRDFPPPPPGYEK